MQVLALEYWRNNTHVEYASVRHEHNMMVHATNSNQQVETCVELKLAQVLFFKYLRNLASLLEKSQLALASALLASNNLCLSSTVYSYIVAT